MKPVRFLGDPLQCVRNFSVDARQDAGHLVDTVQRGLQPDDFKPMSTMGSGVEEIRMRDDAGSYRAICPARLADVLCVLHAFQKQPRRASQRDIELAKARFGELMKDRQ
jgi:phage-related protein